MAYMCRGADCNGLPNMCECVWFLGDNVCECVGRLGDTHKLRRLWHTCAEGQILTGVRLRLTDLLSQSTLRPSTWAFDDRL